MIHFKDKKIVASFYYGWIIVAIGALGIFFSGPGQTYSNAILYRRIINFYSE